MSLHLPPPSPPLLLKRRALTFDDGPRVMGILNCTPDSFSDGGRFSAVHEAVEAALALVADGADLIDVGGESTRPGAAPVSEAEEVRRVIPVIAALRERSDVLISCDTTKAEVARLALEAGADLINDISAMRFEPRIIDVAAAAEAGVILMHTRGTPQRMAQLTGYEDVVAEVAAHLRAQRQEVIARGVHPGRVALDPGLGFAKEHEDNLRLIRHAAALRIEDAPVLIGASRKRFIGALTGEAEPTRRVWGSVGAAVAAAAAGAAILRVHDVKATYQALQVASAVWRA